MQDPDLLLLLSYPFLLLKREVSSLPTRCFFRGQYFDKATELNPEYAAAWNNKGIALFNQREYEEAIKAYDKAIELNPEDAYAWNNKGIALAKQGRYEEAIMAWLMITREL